jgi:predicted alpha/beta hydrolase
VTIQAADGWRLAVTWVRPDAEVRCACVVNSAMGVPHRIYLPLARFLATHGIATLLYDYRGIAGSAPPSLQGFTADVLSWARLDVPAAVAAVRAECPGVPLVLLGHSIGGQLFGLDPVNLTASALIGIAAQSGYWGHWDGLRRIGVWTLWHVAIPLLVPAFDKLPARAAGLGENLPRNVALQWASWGRHPLYVRNPESGPSRQYFDDIEAPLLSVGVERDGLAPARAIEAYRGWFTRAPVTRIDIPARERLGHFGWFREGRGEAHWRTMLGWLDPVLARQRAATPTASA